MRFLLSSACAAAMAILFIAGCGGDGSTLGPDGTPIVEGDPGDGDPIDTDPADSTMTAVTLAQLSADIFTPKCATAGCHANSFPSENMPLTAERIAAAIISVPSNQRSSLMRIAPGDPDNSYLLQKVRGTGAGSQMPLGRSPLSQDEIQLIVDWVAAGAAAE